MNIILWTLALGSLTVGAAAEDTPTTPPATGTTTTSTPPAAPDNSRVNQRDRSGTTTTPPDQAKNDGSSNDSDVKVLAAVRRAITKDDSISTNGHNVKIVFLNGCVTLRGPVKDAAEKAHIADLASKTEGVTSVDNQLDCTN